jgi:outer membrane lipoprotein carrier protein
VRRPENRSWIWLAVALCAAGTVLALPPPTGGRTTNSAFDLTAFEGGSRITALMDEVVARQRSLRSLHAGFVQVKRSSLLLEPTESSGEFLYLAPDRVRWDYSRPDEMVVLFTDDSVTTYLPHQRRAERVKVSRQDRRFVRALAGTLPLDDLTSHFRIRLMDPGNGEPYCLRLTPHERALKKRLDSLLVEVDRELLLPVVVEYNEADGDSTRYEFHGLELDPDLEASRFRLELGEGVTLHFLDATSGIG